MIYLCSQKLAGRPLYFWHGEKDEKIPFQQTNDFVKNNQKERYGQGIVFDYSQTEKHMVKIPLMDTATKFLVQMMNESKE